MDTLPHEKAVEPHVRFADGGLDKVYKPYFGEPAPRGIDVTFFSLCES